MRSIEIDRQDHDPRSILPASKLAICYNDGNGSCIPQVTEIGVYANSELYSIVQDVLESSQQEVDSLNREIRRLRRPSKYDAHGNLFGKQQKYAKEKAKAVKIAFKQGVRDLHQRKVNVLKGQEIAPVVINISPEGEFLSLEVDDFNEDELHSWEKVLKE